MDNNATIYGRTFDLSALEAIQVVARHSGYEDVDIEPMVNGFKLTASREGAPSTVVNGTTLEACRDKFCKAVLT